MLNRKNNISSITGSTRVFGLIGNPVTHSLSPKFWNAALAATDTDAVYLAFDVAEADTTAALAGLSALNVCGINVTRPLKQQAASFCRLLHEPARSTGVVNTIKFGKIGGEGWNTDVTGLQRILARLPQSLNCTTVLGSGASSITALWALKQYQSSRIFQIARKFSDRHGHAASVDFINNKHLPADMAITRLAWNNKNFAYALEESDIIINTTPLGWSSEDEIPEFDRYLDKGKIFIDFNYAPESKLVASARKRGCVVIDGRELLFEQGIESFSLLTGKEAPAEVIRNCIYS